MSKTLSTLLETVNEKMRTWQFHFFVACKIVELKPLGLKTLRGFLLNHAKCGPAKSRVLLEVED